MRDEDFKLKVIEDLAEIKIELKHVKKNIPVCAKEAHEEKLKTLNRLVYLILGTYIPVIVTLIYSFSK